MRATQLLCLVGLCPCAPLSAQGLFDPGPVIDLGAPVGSHDGSPALNYDETYMVFASTRPGGQGGFDLYETTRASLSAPWRPPVAIAALNSPGDDLHPTVVEIAPNLFEVVFASSRPSAPGRRDLYGAIGSPGAWPPPALLLGNVNDGSLLQTPAMTADGLILFYASSATGNGDVHWARRPTLGQPWLARGAFGPASDPVEFDWSPAPDGNGNILFFARRQGGSDDLWVTSEVDNSGSWTTPVPLTNLNTSALEAAPFRRGITGRIYVTHGTGNGLRLRSHDWRVLHQSIRGRIVSGATPQLNLPAPWTLPIFWNREWNWPRASSLVIDNYARPPVGPGAPLVAVLLSDPPSTATPTGLLEEGAFMLNTRFVASLGLQLMGPDGRTTHTLLIPSAAVTTGQRFGLQSVMLDPNGQNQVPPTPTLVWSEPGVGVIR